MNASDIFRQGLATMPHPPQAFYPQPRRQPLPQRHDNTLDGPSNRIAHTLTACCRCRQRKTRCDPTLPRCLPCERSGSVCEYYDSTKGRKISRFYVVKLQEKVRQLEAEMAQFTAEDRPVDTENDMIRPGGLVRLSDSDETPRYLGPSSGIAMTRLLMEEAKRFTESQRISDLIPELNARRMERLSRMQSVAGVNGALGRFSFSGNTLRKKSYPMISEHPAELLPSRPVAARLVEVFNSRAQVFTPTLHEPTLNQDLDDVFNGSTDPYKNFVVRMVVATSLQKLDTQYAGLADGYFLAAMGFFEDVIRPKDLRTLQCLVLIGQYSFLTPTRTNVYHIVGLCTRICQQLAIADEKTIRSGFQVNPLVLDMRRRLTWSVATMELGLAAVMGRPSGFAKCNDLLDVGFFADVDDERITESGIQPGPPSEKKRVAIHFCKMRLLQAEIRRMLYEKKRPEPRNEQHPWFAHMEKSIEAWLDASPLEPAWCKPWFTGRYHSMLLMLYRPSPQMPKPSPTLALKCYLSAAFVIKLGSQQVKKAAIDITWVFLLTVYMSLNVVLWSVSYPEVRQTHSREQVEELVNISLDIVDQCSERWPGASSASQLYAIFSKACLQSYDARDDESASPSAPLSAPVSAAAQFAPTDNAFATPPSQMDSNSPSASDASPMPSANSTRQQQQQQQPPVFNTPQFSYVFSSSEPATINANTFAFDEPPIPNHPQFRSGSIFLNPASTEPMGRRFSYFPPEAPPTAGSNDGSVKEEPATTPILQQTQSSSLAVSPLLSTSPEAFVSPPSTGLGTMSPTTTLTALSSPTPTPTVRHASPMPTTLGMHSGQMMQQPQTVKFEPLESSQSLQALTQAQPAQRHAQQGPLSPAYNMSLPSQTPQRHPLAGAPQPPSSQQPLPTAVQRTVPPPAPPATTTMSDWFSPPPPFISPYTFDNMSNHAAAGYLTDPTAAFSAFGLNSFSNMNTVGGLGGLPGAPGPVGQAPGLGGMAGLGAGGSLQDPFVGTAGGPGGGPVPVMAPGHLHPQRHGSLSQEQQMELMDVLETEGLGEIDTFLNMGIGLGGVGGPPGMDGVSW